MTTTIDNNQKVTLLNPFSVSLKKYPFIEVANQPIYKIGDYKVYKLYDKHYLYTFKNIIFGERCGFRPDLVLTLYKDIKPTGEAALYHDYERPKGAILEGIEAAKKLNFTIQ